MKIRDHIINGGRTFDYEFVKNALDERNLLDLNLVNFLSKKDVADYDKLQTVQKLVRNLRIEILSRNIITVFIVFKRSNVNPLIITPQTECQSKLLIL